MLRQLTTAPHGHILTHTGVWSPCGRWIVYDVRSDPAGSVFDGTRIERVHVETGEVEVLYESRHGACCGVVTCSPVDDRLVFILGPEHPTPDWTYGPARRQGVLWKNGRIENLEARDLVPPFTPGSLQGGTHLHTFCPSGDTIAFTYDDHLRPECNRNVGVCVPGKVVVPPTHPRNHSGTHTARILTRTGTHYMRASEEGWLDSQSLAFTATQADGTRQLWWVNLDGQQRLLSSRPLAGPRHWPRVGPDGRVAVLMADEAGVVQIALVDPEGNTRLLTRVSVGVESAISWQGDSIAHVRGGRVCVADVRTGRVEALTGAIGARPEACVLCPEGRRIAFVCPVQGINQIFVVPRDGPGSIPQSLC
jgi:Tol biopolymer transport system component